MTGQHADGRRPTGRLAVSLPVSLPGILGRLRVDRGPLLGVVLVVTLATGVASAVPRLMDRTADDTVRYAVSSAGTSAELRTMRPIAEPPWQERVLKVDVAAGMRSLGGEVQAEMAESLADVLQEPVTTVATSALAPVTPVGTGIQTLRMYHLSQDPAQVVWVSGGPGRATLTGDEVRAWDEELDPWPVAVALSADVAAELQVGVGDHLATQNENRSVHVDLVVSGIFRATDATDPVWSHAPGILTPRTVGSPLTQRTQVGALLSDEALPMAVRAMPPGSTMATVTFQPKVGAIRAAAVPDIVAEIAGLKADALDSRAGGFYTTPNEVQTNLDSVLRTVAERARAGAAQAWVILAGVLTSLGLTLLLAARLLLHRRSAVLLTFRARGATAAGLAAELGAESCLVAALGTACGVWLAAVAVPGAPPWAWVLPPALLACVAPPFLAVGHVVRRTAGGRRAANRHDRRVLARDRAAARVLAEVTVVLVAVGSVAALRARRIGPTGPDVLTAVAPSLVAVAAAVVLVRLLPLALQWSLHRARRSRRFVGLLAVARAHSTGTAALPFVAVAVAAALAGLSATIAATVVQGQREASWTAIGADAFVQADPDPDLLTVAAQLDARPDVTAVAGAAGRAQVFGRWGDTLVQVVALPAAEYAALVATTPLPPAPQVAALADPDAGVLPVLVSAGVAPDDSSLSLLWEDLQIEVRAAGATPARFGEDVVVVDMARFAAATGVAPAPDRLWLTGPGAAEAAQAAGLAGAEVQLRSEWLSQSRADPLAVALLRLAWAAALLLAGLGATAVVLAAAATSRERGTTLANLATLGVDTRAARRVSAGELLPGVGMAALAGLGCAVVLSAVVVIPLGLRLVTAQPTAPRTVLPLWAGAPVLLAVATVGVLVVVESLGRRRERLGMVLRIGGR